MDDFAAGDALGGVPGIDDQSAFAHDPIVVVVGVIGKDLRTDYTAGGNTTGVAARLLNFARPGQIVISAATRYATEGAFVFGDLGGAGVDGRADPVRAYTVTREIGVREDDYLRYLVEA